MKQIIDDLSLLTIMLDPDDSQSFILVIDLLNDLKTALAKEEGDHTVLLSLIDNGLALHAAANYTVLLELVNEIIATAQSSAGSKKSEATTTANIDIAEELDQELISEFISSHTLDMQEFENNILSNSTDDSSPQEKQELTRSVKSYLHNIKGDAGSVGLLGISRVAHRIEDILATSSAAELVDLLLSFKEWVLETMKAVSGGKALSQSADQFIASIEAGAVTSPEVAVEEKVFEPEVVSFEAPTATTATIENYQIGEDDDLLNDFLVEGEEHIAATEGILLEQKDSYSDDDINTIFRAVHSIKGGAGYFNLLEVVSSSHTTETLLDKARSGETEFDSSLRELMLEYVDFQRALFTRIRKAMAGDRTIVADAEVAEFVNRVGQRLVGQPVTPAAKPTSPVAEVKVEAKPAAVSPSPTAVSSSPAKKETVESLAPKVEKRETVEYIKVDTKRLDKLLEYIGEMVTASSMLIRKNKILLPDNEELNEDTHQLEMILREVQDIGMSMRLVPIKGLFQKMSRVVWDIAKKVNKPIQFHVEGDETELDRTLIERLADPLMHMVRNAVDHGIEPNELRAQTNKSPQGNVTLRAYHKAGNIYVEIEDDGRGLDPKALTNKAREKGLIEADRTLTDDEAFALIFAPGFSTAAQITDVSGRGVGMDVVRKNIESLRGKVTIHSVLGQGSVFRIELPLTLAIVDGIEISVAEQRYLIPTSAIIEIIKLSPDMLVSALDRGETLKFRDSYLPLYPLSEILGTDFKYPRPTEQAAVIVQNGNELVAFRIDAVLGQVSTVIKSLGSVFKDLEGLAGCAIMPDGKIGIILDVNGLIERAHAKLTFSLPNPNKQGEASKQSSSSLPH